MNKKKNKKETPEEREDTLYPYKNFQECPPQKLGDFAEHLFNKMMTGRAKPKDFKVWFDWISK